MAKSAAQLLYGPVLVPLLFINSNLELRFSLAIVACGQSRILLLILLLGLNYFVFI